MTYVRIRCSTQLHAFSKDLAVEPVGDFSLKGIRRPLTANNVLDSNAALKPAWTKWLQVRY
jgi:hypothetical protein